MSKLLKVSSNPHVRDNSSTTSIMLDVIIALIPATIFGIYNAGSNALHAALLILVTVGSCVLFEFIYQFIIFYINHHTYIVGASVLFEFIYQKHTKQKVTVTDMSAALTGLLLALNLPPTFPIWMAVIGAAFAIIVVKQVFGGLGQNFMNPALGARCFLFLSFSAAMTTFSYDGVTGATPLYTLKTTGEVASLSDMFIGTTGGTIGETSVIALLIGAVYLLVKKIIDFRIPLFYLLTFSVFILIFGDRSFDIEYLLAQLCGGGLMLGAFFMATDYVTSPITPVGRIVFGVLLGLLTGIFRVFGANAEGVSFAIIFCNLLVPLIEKVTKPRPFGYEHMKKEGK